MMLLIPFGNLNQVCTNGPKYTKVISSTLPVMSFARHYSRVHSKKKDRAAIMIFPGLCVFLMVKKQFFIGLQFMTGFGTMALKLFLKVSLVATFLLFSKDWNTLVLKRWPP